MTTLHDIDAKNTEITFIKGYDSWFKSIDDNELLRLSLDDLSDICLSTYDVYYSERDKLLTFLNNIGYNADKFCFDNDYLKELIAEIKRCNNQFIPLSELRDRVRQKTHCILTLCTYDNWFTFYKDELLQLSSDEIWEFNNMLSKNY